MQAHSPINDGSQSQRQIVGTPEKSLSNKGDWLGKIAVVRDVVRCSDDVEGGRNSQPQKTERGRHNAVLAGGLTPVRMYQGSPGVYVYFFSTDKFFFHSVQPFVETKFQHLLTNLKEFFCNFLKFLLAFPLKYLNRLNISYILIYFSSF